MKTALDDIRLYRRSFEKDSCGFGLIAQLDGQARHRLIQDSIQALIRLTHRGAVAADGKSGDGCGLLLAWPEEFLRSQADHLGLKVGKLFAVGVVFLSPQSEQAAIARQTLTECLHKNGLEAAGWRTVPVDAAVCGHEARAALPLIEQVFVKASSQQERAEFESRLFLARRQCELDKRLAGDDHFYVASLSSRLISYKALIMPENFLQFYGDLRNPQMTASICVFHQRFSTNTLPQWRLAQPFRLLAHNGEINTILGNRNWAKARAHILDSSRLPGLSQLSPLVSMDGSDSSSLDNMLEIMLLGGLGAGHAMRMLIPPAWQNTGHMDADLRAFHEYHSMYMEPWDGPAGIAFTDGRYAVCALDRNGLRPARYVLGKDRTLMLASEIGIRDYEQKDVLMKGRLGPGDVLIVDTKNGALRRTDEIDQRLKKRRPYRKWLDKTVISMENQTWSADPPLNGKALAKSMKLFGVSQEEVDQVIRVLAEVAQEAVGSMGDDTPLPVFSLRTRSIFDSFRQQFAQVTNPPIDPLREQIVMSLEVFLGPEINFFAESPEQGRRMALESPILDEATFKKILACKDPAFQNAVFNLQIDEREDYGHALAELLDQVVEAIKEKNTTVIVLSDRLLKEKRIPLHAALACGAVHHRLIEEGLRCRVNLIVESGFARDPHHCAVLIAYGATAVYPYLAYQIITNLYPRQANGCQQYRQGLNKGLYKIISKMGISTIASYRGAQLFEIVGLHDEVVKLCFKNTVSRVQGIRFSDLREDQRRMAWQARQLNGPINQGGLFRYTHGGEYHAYNPDVVKTLQQAVQSGDYEDYKKYADCVNNRPVSYVRDLLRLKTKSKPIPLEQVEAAESILWRFDSAGMSLGALSPEAHQTLAQAMNGLGGRSNSGEGGEDPERYHNDKKSKIKQVASGRFGVTPYYLSNAEVLQIKIAQGAKPGEGGQLPGDKVNATIAKLRYASEGISLISPPPHHDIYSIEDLAQLIFDLKQVNPEALVSVKLVSAAGVGTIAAGVTKAYADLITISGYDGGTGASPLTSIKYAGTPWEFGLPETHRILQANNLRDKVRLQTDGGLKSGLDVVKAALLGAESFGFGTAPMIAMGCKYLRLCHLNNCATGVATQNKILRRRHFIGQVEMVMNYFRFVAEETREWMAALHVRQFSDLIGRSDLLEETKGITSRQQSLDLSAVVEQTAELADKPRYNSQKRNPPFDRGLLAEKILADARELIDGKLGGELRYPIDNTCRSIGARLSGEIAKKYGDQGMNKAPITVHFQGTAGQSFGAWNVGGLNLHLQGEANDYVGKGMAGGEIVIRPPADSPCLSKETPIIGNTCLYGATGGRLFAAGTAGERFAVRNSGVVAVVEGLGDHGCEYMTGGVVLVLGRTGINFGAGMTGGFSYVLDLDNDFIDRCNHGLVETCRIDSIEMERHRRHLHELIKKHVDKTGSSWGRKILDDLPRYVPHFQLVKSKAAELKTLIDSVREAA